MRACRAGARSPRRWQHKGPGGLIRPRSVKVSRPLANRLAQTGKWPNWTGRTPPSARQRGRTPRPQPGVHCRAIPEPAPMLRHCPVMPSVIPETAPTPRPCLQPFPLSPPLIPHRRRRRQRLPIGRKPPGRPMRKVTSARLSRRNRAPMPAVRRPGRRHRPWGAAPPARQRRSRSSLPATGSPAP